MSSLLAIQQSELAHAIRTDSAPATTLLKPTAQGTPARVTIYSTAYRIRLGEALKENYPILARVLGDEGFASLALAFLRACPSSTPSIRWFGTSLEEFVKCNDEIVPHPALLDLIRMEWALNSAFDAADAEPMQVAELLKLAAEEWPLLKFSLHPSHQLLPMEWNVEPLWAALSADEHAEPDAPEQRRHHLLIWRVGYKTQWRSVELVEAQLLYAAMARQSFGALCETAAELIQKSPDAKTDTSPAEIVAGYLRVWIEAGLLSGYAI